MIKSYKIRIYPNKTQEEIINRTLGACRWIWNDFLFRNIERYKRVENNDLISNKYITGYEYSKMLTIWKKSTPDYMWLNEISQKAIHEAFMDCDEAFKKFFKKESGFPKFKSKKYNPITGYFFIGDKIKFKGHKVTLPILGKIKISEYNYVPKDKKIVGGTIVKDIVGKYYAVFRIDIDTEPFKEKEMHSGYGIDVGISNYITIYQKHGEIIHISSFLNHKYIIDLENRIKEYQKIIANKMEINKQKSGKEEGNYSNRCRTIQKKINRSYKKLRDYKINWINHLVVSLVRLKPKYITIEDLQIKNLLEMDSSHTLHNHIQKSMFGYFYQKLKETSEFYGFELRIANKYFASSKICCECGHKKKDLSLNDRIYYCPECGNRIDRDENAAINLCNLKKYTIYKP